MLVENTVAAAARMSAVVERNAVVGAELVYSKLFWVAKAGRWRREALRR